jgi:Fic family protein
METPPPPLDALDPQRFEHPRLLKLVAAASRQLAELKGLVASIPNEAILINTLALQEAKDSSAVENIVTTHDELFRDAASALDETSLAGKEVLRYRQALQVGWRLVTTTGLLTNNHLLEVHSRLELNRAGFRKVPGTALREAETGRVVFTPPQDAATIVAAMGDLERFLNATPAYPVDPLIRMALAHHRFETIHPFYDGNGRTGRILNVLYLVKEGLLDLPVLYLSRHIVRTKGEYYALLQAVRDDDRWEDWVAYMLEAVEGTAREGITVVGAIRTALFEVKHEIRQRHAFYSQDLINNLFSHPYTKVQFVMESLGVSRITATKYLDALVQDGILERLKVGRTNYYLNVRLVRILTGAPQAAELPSA